MHQYMLRNGKPFPMQKLTVIKGSIPKSIQGSYFKNGPGLLTIGEDVLPHWFIGAAGLLKV
jgi:carotenoid cleavage dioxygenase-like enzyme